MTELLRRLNEHTRSLAYTFRENVAARFAVVGFLVGACWIGYAYEGFWGAVKAVGVVVLAPGAYLIAAVSAMACWGFVLLPLIWLDRRNEYGFKSPRFLWGYDYPRLYSAISYSTQVAWIGLLLLTARTLLRRL